MPKLTKRLLDATPCPATGEVWLADETLPGFGVRLRAGRKTYGVRYRTQTGTPRRATLGLTTVLTLDAARTQAQAVLAAVRQGADPAAARQALRQGPTVADLVARYLAEHAEPKKKPSSVQDDRRYLTVHLLPLLGTTPVTQVTRQDLATLHQRLRATPVAANRFLGVCSSLFHLAEVWGLRAEHTNPARHIPHYPERPRERYVTGEELVRLGAVLAAAAAAGREHPSVLGAVRLLLLTGARVGEILALRWAYLHWDRGLALLPDSKTGAKTLYLSSQALAVLRALPTHSAWVLPGSHAGKPLGDLRRPWHRLRTAAGLPGVRLHDLRHTYASHLAMAGVSLPIIGRLLGHTTAQMTQRYAHFADDTVRQAAEHAGVLVGQALQGDGALHAPSPACYPHGAWGAAHTPG